MSAGRQVRVAVDLLGGDNAPGAVVDGACAAAAADPDVRVVLVGPPDIAREHLVRVGAAADAIEVVAASEVVGMDEDPGRGVRAKRDATVRVAARLVRDGLADATVSVGSTGAAMAAALFTWGRLPGVTRPAVAVEVPAATGPLLLLDAGANVDCTPDLLAQFALAGAAYAQVRLARPAPRVGLLSIGTEPGKGDALRAEAFEVLRALPLDFVGNVESTDVALGGRADVVVSDGFAGNVLLKGLEGMLALARLTLAQALDDPTDALRALDPLSPDRAGGAVLLGVPGVAVIGHGGAGADAVAACVALAAGAVRDRMVARVGEAMAQLVAARRRAAGLDASSLA